ncbi:retrotransposon gag protein [Trifolium medium]|uniref:Retrotransposon gag protein n=1 Tax=Trifolium medium TaxID=97028 RepID=A0A392MVU0_9FABA|nr:retrotransposon gag protein [Trifolium medium]
MGDLVNALEATVEEMKSTMGTLVQQMQQHGALLAEISKQLGLRRSNESTSTNPPVRENSVEASTMNESRLAGKKVKLPLFEGDDPVTWITRTEIYFDVQQTPDEMRVKLLRLSMEGPTIHWFNLLMQTEDHLSWEKLKKSLIVRYGGRRLENPFEELMTLKQSGSVEEFVEAFELLSSQVGRLHEEQYLGYFMSGLKPQIRRRVRTLNPLNRMQMMRIAKDVVEVLKEGDEEEGRGTSKKGVYDRVGKNDWAGSFAKGRNGSNRSLKFGLVLPDSKNGLCCF